MIYNSFKPAVSGKDVGSTFPQSQDFESKIHIESPNYLNMCFGRKFPEDLYTPNAILHKRAKPSDLISAAWTRFPIISSKLRDIIAKSDKQGLEFAPIKVISGNDDLNYWVMNSYLSDYELIDFAKSVVVTIGIGQVVTNTLHIETVKGLNMALESVQQPERVWINKLCLKANVNDDIVMIDLISGGKYLISENLKQEIETAKCTGILYNPLDPC